MNIFANLKKYAAKWNETNVRNFDKQEINYIERAIVVASQYGLSVCFMIKGGGRSYIPLEMSSERTVGEAIDLSKAKLVTLSREGNQDIYRVRA